MKCYKLDTITEMKNTFNELISRFDIVKQIFSVGRLGGLFG